jgi:hypothetical protein
MGCQRDDYHQSFMDFFIVPKAGTPAAQVTGRTAARIVTLERQLYGRPSMVLNGRNTTHRLGSYWKIDPESAPRSGDAFNANHDRQEIGR